MGFQLMCFEIHLRFEDHKLLIHAVLVGTKEMVLTEMLFQRIVVYVVLLLLCWIPSIANVTLLVLFPAMHIQFVIAIESLAAESTFGMTLEPTLINSAWIVIPKFLMLSELLLGEQFMLMGKNLFISCT